MKVANQSKILVSYYWLLVVILQSSCPAWAQDDGIGGGDEEALWADIIGGDPASAGRFPYYAVPDFTDGLCGSVLIAPAFLLTAAHCAGVFQGNQIYIGGTLLNGADAREKITALKEYKHPDFYASSDPFRLDNDIMLVQLAYPSFSPLAVWNTNPSVPQGVYGTRAIGFGKTEENNPSPVLLQADLETSSSGTCTSLYPSGMIDSNKHLCAGKPGWSYYNKRTCAGDSGGPLLDAFDGTVLGVTSFGRRENGLCTPDTPSVFTRVSTYDAWIRSTVCSLSTADFCNDTAGGGSTGEATNPGPAPTPATTTTSGSSTNPILQLLQLVWQLLVDLFSV